MFLCSVCFFFFFKQKTAYEMRISDWSSDVCSSDLGCRAFIRDNLPTVLADKSRRNIHLDKEDFVTWHRILHRQGWGAPNWPREYGGPGWRPVERYIFDEETANADAPALVPFGISMVGPVIYTFGTEAQKRHYLPRILSMDDWWCQGYSEPGSGSDLASLRTQAESDGHDYIVSGPKI